MPIVLNGTTGITTPTYNGNVAAEYLVPVTGFKNRIINGAMVIDQRNAGAEVNPAVTNTYYLDRWAAVSSEASKFKIGQNAGAVTPPAGFTNYLGTTSLSAYSLLSVDRFGVTQYIEGFNIADLNWGTANAKTVTISFWVYSSLSGTFGGSLQNNGRSRSYPFTYTISAANTWEQKSVTIVGDTTGTWGTTSGRGIILNFSLGSGSDYSGTAGAWAGSDFRSTTGAVSVVGTNGATFYITGVQLEVGTVATSFDFRSYGTELALCQRYYQTFGGVDGNTIFGTGIIQGSTNSEFNIVLPVQMRAAPTASISGTASNFLVASNQTTAATAIGFDIYTINTFRCSPTIGSGLITPGYGAFLRANGSTAAKINVNAEL
jgi:hypothetical protein